MLPGTGQGGGEEKGDPSVCLRILSSQPLSVGPNMHTHQQHQFLNVFIIITENTSVALPKC